MSKETSVSSNRTDIAAQSGSSFPADLSDSLARNSQTLFEWLGSFWSEIYEDQGFIENLQDARALRIAQLYLDLLEGLKLHDRENAPVFHRERWHPIILRRSKRNTGSKTMVRVSDDGTIVLGQQTHEIYPPGTVVELGSKEAHYRNMVVYPLDEESMALKGVLTCISNNIASASVVLGSGTDFALLDGAIAISEDQDPFEGENAEEWPKFEVVAENPEDNDEETVLWACDAMFDQGLVYRHLGYVMRLPGESSEVYKRVVNAAWNAVASGCTPLLLRSLMAAICGIPTVKEEGEVVERIVDGRDGSVQVITSKNVYSFPKYTELRDDVVPGAELKRFDTLDKAIRVYSCANRLDGMVSFNEFLSDFGEFMDDVPAMDLPPALFRVDLEGGFSVGWAEEDVTCVGFFDEGRTRPKLRFPMGGSEEDDDAFWEGVWAAYASSGESMESCLDGVVHDSIFETGKVCGRISPMRFFMRNLIGANTLIMTVRTDTLADDAPLYDPKFFGVVRECVPAYIRLYVIEHESAESDLYDTEGQDGDGSSSDDADLYEYDEYEEKVANGGRGGGPKVRDGVSSKWVATCGD